MITRQERKQLRRDRLTAAVDALADLYEYGHLTAIARPDELLMQAVEEIRASRKPEEHREASHAD